MEKLRNKSYSDADSTLICKTNGYYLIPDCGGLQKFFTWNADCINYALNNLSLDEVMICYFMKSKSLG